MTRPVHDDVDAIIRQNIKAITTVDPNDPRWANNDVIEKYERSHTNGSFFMGEPDGPMRYIPSLGESVPTYIDPRLDLRSGANCDKAHKSVDYHVPQMKRGTYLPNQLADYDPEKNYPITDKQAVRCSGLKADGQICQKSARNMTGFCTNHGGALHPADKMFTTERDIRPSDLTKLTRKDKVELGIIPISDLDDEEISKQQVREDDGTFSKKSQILSTKIGQQMRAEFLERADRFMRENAFDMLKVMRDIAISDLNEPKDRITAAQFNIERVLGKTPDVLITSTSDTPFETLYNDVLAGGTREEYRKQRGLTPNVIDGEIEAAPVMLDEEDNDEENEDTAETQLVVETQDTRIPSLLEIEAQTEEASIESPEPEPAEVAPEVENNVIDRMAEKKAAADRIKKARSRRYAARSQGATSLENLWYEVTFPTDKRLEGTGTHRMRFISPDDVKVPKTR